LPLYGDIPIIEDEMIGGCHAVVEIVGGLSHHRKLCSGIVEFLDHLQPREDRQRVECSPLRNLLCRDTSRYVKMRQPSGIRQPFLDTVRTRPDWLVQDASRERMELASKAGALTMGLDAVETIQARDSTEKMLMHQLAAAHSLVMRMAAASW